MHYIFLFFYMPSSIFVRGSVSYLTAITAGPWWYLEAVFFLAFLKNNLYSFFFQKINKALIKRRRYISAHVIVSDIFKCV
jgi:hypothetical protein